MLASAPRVVQGNPRCPSKSVRGVVPVRCPGLCATFSKRRNQSSFLRASSTEIPSVSKSEDGENGRGRVELAGNNQTEEQAQRRIGVVERKTKETSVYVKLNLDGTGQCDAVCGVPFLEHMLDVRSFLFICLPVCLPVLVSFILLFVFFVSPFKTRPQRLVELCHILTTDTDAVFFYLLLLCVLVSVCVFLVLLSLSLSLSHTLTANSVPRSD